MYIGQKRWCTELRLEFFLLVHVLCSIAASIEPHCGLEAQTAILWWRVICSLITSSIVVQGDGDARSMPPISPTETCKMRNEHVDGNTLWQVTMVHTCPDSPQARNTFALTVTMVMHTLTPCSFVRNRTFSCAGGAAATINTRLVHIFAIKSELRYDLHATSRIIA